MNQKPFPCKFIDPETSENCEQAFDTAGRLRAHERRLHGEKLFWCTVCAPGGTLENVESGFRTYTLLQDHIRMMHSPVCTQCSKVYSNQRELRNHVEIQHQSGTLNE